MFPLPPWSAKNGQRFRPIYRLHTYRDRKGESKSFAWTDYRDLLIAAHLQLDAPIVVVWDNLGRYLLSTRWVRGKRSHPDGPAGRGR